MHIFLTACRNEEATIPEFLTEFVDVVERAGLRGQSVLYVVDDFSTDGTVALLEGFDAASHGVELRVIRAPTNLGNQGAMFHGLRRVQICPADVLITFDSDGEDDVGQIPSILELAAQNPAKVVLIERGRRKESVLFKVFFASYKLLFRFFTRQTVVPNNFLLIPGMFVPFIQCAPLAAVHFAYAVLKLRPPYVATVRDRRSRYGGRSSQNIFMLVSHGLVGLMLFFEVVVAKIFMAVFLFCVAAAAVIGPALAFPMSPAVRYLLIWLSVVVAAGGMGLFGLLLSAALALIFKLVTFTLVESTFAQPSPPTLPAAGVASGRRDAPIETAGRGAS